MSRKPIDKQQPHECRQAIWEWVRERGWLAFTVNDVACSIHLEPGSIRDYLTGLTKAGYLEASKVPRRGRAISDVTYTHIKDTGVDAPRVRKDGTPVTQGIGRRQIWNAMQVLKEFSPRDLAFNASTDDHRVAEGEANTYCKVLCQAGYLVARGTGRYALIPSKWTGPHPPQIQRTRQVYDPNLKKVVWGKIEGGAE